MPSSVQQLAELILSVQGTDAVKDLRDNLAANDAAIDALRRSYEQGSLSVDEFLRKSQSLLAEENRLKTVINHVEESIKAQAAAANNAGGATGIAGQSAKNAHHSFMQLGQTLDDLQYVGEMGLRPIINNVMQLDARMGLALIAVDFLYKAVGDKLVKAFQDFTGQAKAAEVSLESLEKKVKDLEARPHKLAVDYADLDAAQAKLNRLKAEEAAYNASKESKPEKELGAQASDVVTGYLGGSDALRGVVMATEKASGFNHGSAEDQALLKRLKYQLEHPEIDARTGLAKVDPEVTKRNIAEVEARMERDAMDFAGKEVAQFAAGDPAAIARMKNRAVQSPGAFARTGMDGLTGAEAVANLPGTVAEAQRRAEVEREIVDTDETDKQNLGEFKAGRDRKAKAKIEADKAQKAADAAVQREEDELDKFAKADEVRRRTQEADDAKRRDNQRIAMETIKKKEADAKAKRVAEAQNPEQAAVNRLSPEAEQRLRQSGLGADEAKAYAPQLARAVLNGADVNIATQQLVREVMVMLNMAQQREAMVRRMLGNNQADMARMRSRQPTRQDMIP